MSVLSSRSSDRVLSGLVVLWKRWANAQAWEMPGCLGVACQ